MTAYTIGLSVIYVGRLVKHFIRSAFCPPLRLPIWERNGGKGRFSHLKNCFRLPLWLWKAMYNPEKSTQSSFKDSTLALSFERIFLLWVMNVGRLAFCRGSVSTNRSLPAKFLNSFSLIFGIVCTELTAAIMAAFVWIASQDLLQWTGFPFLQKKKYTLFIFSKCTLKAMFLFVVVMILSRRYFALKLFYHSSHIRASDSRKKPVVAPKRGLIALAVSGKATWRTKKRSSQSLFWWYSRCQCERRKDWKIDTQPI